MDGYVGGRTDGVDVWMDGCVGGWIYVWVGVCMLWVYWVNYHR